MRWETVHGATRQMWLFVLVQWITFCDAQAVQFGQNAQEPPLGGPVECASTNSYVVAAITGGECVTFPTPIQCVFSWYTGNEFFHLHTGAGCTGEADLFTLAEPTLPSFGATKQYSSVRFTSTATSPTKRFRRSQEVAKRADTLPLSINPQNIRFWQNGAFLTLTAVHYGGIETSGNLLTGALGSIWSQLDAKGSGLAGITSLDFDAFVSNIKIDVTLSMIANKVVDVNNLKFMYKALANTGDLVVSGLAEADILGAANTVIGHLKLEVAS